MGACCGSCCKRSEDPEKSKKFGEELKDGPIPDSARGCTDIFCIPIFIFAQVVFIIVSLAGMQNGDPSKLYKPRDFGGAYCGVSENWNSGPNTEIQPKLTYTMNVTSTVDTVMKQFICSSYAKTVLTGGSSPLLDTPQKIEDYNCDCCHSPCAKCMGSLEVGGDLTTGSDSSSTISGRMSELTGASSATNLFSHTGANGDMFGGTNFWSEATKYFTQVCLPECSSTQFDNVNSSADAREYVYKPSQDDALYDVWETLLNDDATPTDIKDTISNSFTFKALPFTTCPYSPQYCVPMPGMEFKEAGAGSNLCTFELAAAVIDAVGATAASALESIGLDSFASGATESFGDWMGTFQTTIDAFFIVAVCSFVVGLIFLVLLRFALKLCVWIAVAITVLMFFIGGAAAFIRSGQCQGVDFFDTGTQVGVAIATTATTAAGDLISGEDAVSEEMDATGDGSDYRGVQYLSKMGHKCLKWDTQILVPRFVQYNSTAYPHAALRDSYCRNPFGANDTDKAKSIWCITSDPNYPWEECIPIGIIQPECQHGYAVKGETGRKVLYYCAFVIWGLGVFWMALILCMIKRIKLAIAVNEVAATFVQHNAQSVIIPIVQALCAIVWTIAWVYSASFLLSQVPDGYIPKEGFATYAEAYGTSSSCAWWDMRPECNGTPGACNDKWPVGTVWKTNDCNTDANGDMACWRCSPPRYVLDARFAISFFVFLWNNAFNLALGQILIASAVSIWFFSTSKLLEPVVIKSLHRVFRYHLGSVAFGSFIIAVIQFIRYLMKYFEKQAAAQKNRLLVLILKCVQCCIWCFEKCVQFLNKNAYIQIALLGHNFCTSAKKAFYLILRNALRFGTIAILGSAIHAIGFVCIMSGTTVVGYFIVRALHEDVSPMIPIITYIAMSYVVAKLYMNVFGLAVDTSLQCFLACEEGGIGGDFIPSQLRAFVDKHAKEKTKDMEAES